MTIISLKNKPLAEQCFENSLLLEKIIGYSDPNSMCALARLNKRTNQVYKDVNEEKFPKLYEKRIQRVFTHLLSEHKTALALSVEKYLKIMEERKSSGKSIPSLENPFGRPVSLVERLLSPLLWILGYKPEEPDVSKVEYTGICRELVPPKPEAVLLDHSTVLAISPGFINREIAQLYLTCIKEIKSTLSSFIKNGRLFECRALIKSPQLNPDILDDICWKVIQDTRMLEKFDECALSSGNDDSLFDEFFGASLYSLKEVYRYGVATRKKDLFWVDRLRRDLQRKGIQREWTYELLRQRTSVPGGADKAFEEIKEVYKKIWSIEKLETEPEDTRLLEELIESRPADIGPIILNRALMIAILNIKNDNTRLLKVLIKSYECAPNKAIFVSLENIFSELISTGHDRIADLLRGLDRTNESF